MEKFKQFLAANNLPPNAEVDAVVHRFGDGDAEWYIAKKLHLNGKDLITVCWGDWRTNEKNRWCSDEEVASDPKVIAALEEQQKKALEEKLERHETVAKQARIFFNDLPNSFSKTDYQIEKGIVKPFKTRRHKNNLIVPLQDLEGKLWGYQTIAVGFKGFTPGMKVRGSFHLFGSLDATKYYLCEGWATGASIWEALGGNGGKQDFAVLSCCNAGNLPNVYTDISQGPKKVEVIICADNDAFKKDNVGIDAAKKCKGAAYTYPIFDQAHLDKMPTDFNDLHALQGLEEVKRQLLLDRSRGEGKTDTVVSGPPTGDQKPAKPKRMKQAQACFIFVEGAKRDMLVSRGDFFKWRGTHWEMLGEEENKEIKRGISKLYGEEATNRLIEDTIKMIKIHLPSPPKHVNMFEAPKMCSNFLNGTLHMVPTEEDSEEAKELGAFKLDFRPHNKHDYITTKPSVTLDETEKTTNADFEAMLDRILGTDEDGNQKRAAVSEMFGACLIGHYPNIWLAIGSGGTGKSSLIICAQHLLSEDNFSSIEPQHMRGTGMESIIGKPANIVTDISPKALNDSALKRIDDRGKITVHRKYKDSVSVSLPPTHIYCANEMPTTTDDDTEAWDRRITYLQCENKVGGTGAGVRDYGDWIFKEAREAIAVFAMKGLRRVIKNGGHYTQPGSGARALKNWTSSNRSVVGTFLADIGEGEVKYDGVTLSFDPNGKAVRGKTWDVFKAWAEEAEPKARLPGRNKFFASVQNKGYKISKTDGVWYVNGINSTPCDAR